MMNLRCIKLFLKHYNNLSKKSYSSSIVGKGSGFVSFNFFRSAMSYSKNFSRKITFDKFCVSNYLRGVYKSVEKKPGHKGPLSGVPFRRRVQSIQRPFLHSILRKIS